MRRGKRKIVIVNQASNYLTVGLVNAFSKEFDETVLLTGSVHIQGEEVSSEVKIDKLNQWYEKPALKKAVSYCWSMISIFFKLLFKYRGYEVLFVSIPPTAYIISLIIPNKCSMLIWDVYPDTLKITGMQDSHWIYRLWSSLNKIVFKKAFRIFTIGERMADILSQYTSRERLIIQPIWSIFSIEDYIPKKSNPFIEKHKLEDKYVVQYSGNIGLTHNVEVLIDLARMVKNRSILFMIIGRGPRQPELKRIVENEGLENCMFLPFQSDDEFLYSLSSADLGVVILNGKVSKGSVPSKSYNIMSLGIPSLYLASPESELGDYANQYGHAECFESSELQAAADFIDKLSVNSNEQRLFSEASKNAAKNYTRTNANIFVEKYLN